MKTLLCVLTQTVAFTIVMIPSTPILDDVLAACLIGGLICGFGIGLALRSGGSGGGLDILGYTSQRSFQISALDVFPISSMFWYSVSVRFCLM